MKRFIDLCIADLGTPAYLVDSEGKLVCLYSILTWILDRYCDPRTIVTHALLSEYSTNKDFYCNMDTHCGAFSVSCFFILFEILETINYIAEMSLKKWDLFEPTPSTLCNPPPPITQFVS